MAGCLSHGYTRPTSCPSRRIKKLSGQVRPPMAVGRLVHIRRMCDGDQETARRRVSSSLARDTRHETKGYDRGVALTSGLFVPGHESRYRTHRQRSFADLDLAAQVADSQSSRAACWRVQALFSRPYTRWAAQWPPVRPPLSLRCMPSRTVPIAGEAAHVAHTPRSHTCAATGPCRTPEGQIDPASTM